MANEQKITLFLAIQNEQTRTDLEMLFMTLYLDISVVSFSNPDQYFQNLKSQIPSLVVVDSPFLAAAKERSILKEAVQSKPMASIPFIVLGHLDQRHLEEKDSFLDEMMVGKLQYFEKNPNEEEWRSAVSKAFKFSFDPGVNQYSVKNISAGDILIKVGDPADKIYILKKGKLQAYHSDLKEHKVILGEIHPGEFVGEMAYFNSEPRSANVIALEHSELIEIPLKTFDRVIYQKPAWAMKLIETLTKRLKKSNLK